MSAADAPGRPGPVMAQPQDVARLYRLFLGRPPENEDKIQANTGRDLRLLAMGLIRSPEFAARLHKLETAGRLSWPESQPDDRDFLQGFLRLDPSGGPAGDGAGPLLAVALAGADLWPEFERLFAGRAQPLIALLRPAVTVAAKPVEWMGYIDEADTSQIRGWVMRKDDPAPVTVGILLNDRLIARVEASRYRGDVAQKYGVQGNCGFRVAPALSAGLLRGGAHTLSLVHLDSGQRIPVSRAFAVRPQAQAPQAAWIATELEDLTRHLAEVTARMGYLARTGPVPLDDYDWFRSHRPLCEPPAAGVRAAAPGFSVVMPVLPGESEAAVAASAASLRAQTCPDWDLVAVVGRQPETGEPAPWRDALPEDSRIRRLETIGIRSRAHAAAVGLRAARGSHLLFLDPGTELDPLALAWLAQAITATGARMVYADDCVAEPIGSTERLWSQPRLKPAFDPDLLMQHDYIGTAFCVATAAAKAAGGVVPADAEVALRALVLRVAEHLEPGAVVHLPLPLFQLAPGTSAGIAPDAARKPVLDHLKRTGRAAAAVQADPGAGLNLHDDWLSWPVPAPAPRLTIVIPTRDRRDLLEPCLNSLRATLVDPAQTEILVVDNRSTDPATRAYLDRIDGDGLVRVLPFDEDFNWSRVNNAAAAASAGDVLLFANNDIECLTPGFDAVIRGQLARPEIGALGCLLLYPDGAIQHAGTVLGTGGLAAHIGAGLTPADPQLAPFTRFTRRVGAVTGAFLATRRDAFEALGGFDEEALKITLNDVDFCMRLARQGLATLYTPAICCLHHESASRGDDRLDPVKAARALIEQRAFRARHGEDLRFDLWHNPGYSAKAAPFSALVMPDAEAVGAYLRRQAGPTDR